MCSPEAKHQSFKRLSKTIFWPRMLLQFAEKHNLRVAFDIQEVCIMRVPCRCHSGSEPHCLAMHHYLKTIVS